MRLCLVWDGRGFDPPAQRHSFVEIGHEIIFTAFRPPVVSYWPKNVDWINCLGLSLPRKSVVRLTDRLDMTIAVEWDVKPQKQQQQHQSILCFLLSFWINVPAVGEGC